MSVFKNVRVRIDDDYWASIDTDAQRQIMGWGFVIAGESIIDGDNSGPVFLGQDGGRESRHVGTWEVTPAVAKRNTTPQGEGEHGGSL